MIPIRHIDRGFTWPTMIQISPVPMWFRMYVSYEVLLKVSISSVLLAFVSAEALLGLLLIPVIAFIQKRDPYAFRAFVRYVYTRLLFLRSTWMRWPGSFD
jgi:hypothetical protein